ncbi:FtsK/SpoIIIE domain-containing protein [Streptomyces wuyuanensis]|uniref:DNA segregation ATPase FtsK/SpoIIIE, S-DNA-T family n=1 Tax=Streptomyces wuyuanensis TaxID=1196353 RepID=A0A1G9Z9J9_9ACTN|nr:AAA family ATPase [Streptomyces wuyuanensis]SDN18168.1 DNA segregation ATPase FtsK/SpoIIIE, S-DNA-T family [Streptomyces wuyuanensis]
MSVETTPSSMPDPEWERLVGSFFSGPGAAPEAAPVVKQTAGADPMGDTPLTPAWTKTRAGWKARAHVGRVNSARGFRRWLRRQATEHGHAAQTWRGIARTALWVQGVEGVQVLASRHEVQQAQRDYKSAKWAHDKRLIPGTEKDKRRKDMEAAFAESSKALAGYKKARAEARTKRALRGAAALAPVAAVEGAGIHLLGAPGGLMATGATLAALALLGRRTTAGELYTDRDAKIGDGDRMTDDMVNRVYRSAKVIGTDDVVKLLSPCTLTADGAAWEVRLELPDGIPASKALGATPQLANGFGVSVQQVSQTKGEREDWLTLRVTLKVPFTGKPHKGPLLAAEKVNLWAPVPMAVSERGDVMAVDWFEKTALFGGEPGAGKSAAANNPLLAASLDVTADFYLADGKGGFDLTPFEPIAQMIDTDGDPKKLLAILTHVWEVVLPELKQTVKDHSVRKFSESLAAKDKRVRFTILYIDEWASYMAAASPEQQKELERLLRLITQQGRAYAVIVIAATQKPDSNAVPTGIRDILSTRWAGRCMTPEASDTILGKGRATAGYNAQRILKSQRGVGYLQTGETSEPVLTQSYFYTDDEVETILRRAYELRQRAGVLPAAAEPDILDHLLKAAASTGRGNVTRAEVFAHLATVDGEFVQGADESDVRYASRAGSALKDRLAVLGVDVPAVQFPLDGKRVWGWTVEALQRAR